MAQARRDKEKADEGQKLAPVAQAAPPRLSNRAPQGPCVCYQQDTKEIQSTSGLIFQSRCRKNRLPFYGGRFSFVAASA